MSLRDKIPMMVEHLNGQANLVKHNSALFDIYEGDLLSYLEKDLANQLSPDSYRQVMSRVSPINVLQKLIDKLSKIYQDNPTRSVVDGNDTDTELLGWYEKSFMINKKMNSANEFFNMFKNTLLQPFVHNGRPRLRAIPSDQFTVISTDEVDPTYPTIYITFHGRKQDALGVEHKLYYAYSDEEFLAFTDNGEVAEDVMARFKNNGLNEYGRAPFVYVNRSENLLIPKPDTDVLKMTKIIPIILSDLNYAVMYQAFSLVYGINLDVENIRLNPNTFVNFKQDMESQSPPQVGVIKPEVDISEVLNLVFQEMGAWLETKGIKAGSIGKVDGQNISNGISKILDEMDTSDHRKRQVEYFETAEKELWDLVFKYMHPVWSKRGVIENRALFTPKANVETIFAEQIPLTNRGTLIEDMKKEVDSGFTTRRRAIKKLNPGITEAELEELLSEIEEERTISVDEDMDDDGSTMAEGVDTD